MIFDIHTNNIIHVTVTPEELRQDGHNIDWTNDSSIFTTDGIELDKTYYFSYHIHPILSESAYPKTLDFSFTGYELNDKLRDYFEVLNEATLLRDSSNLMVDIAIRSEQ